VIDDDDDSLQIKVAVHSDSAAAEFQNILCPKMDMTLFSSLQK
jgi:hypothetical protein